MVKRKLLTVVYAQIWLDDDQRTLQPVAEPREIVTRLHQAARHVEGGSRSDVKLAKESENMADGAASVEAAVGSGDVSLTPATSTKTPPGAELRGRVFEQDECGRDDRTRTCDLLLPKQAR